MKKIVILILKWRVIVPRQRRTQLEITREMPDSGTKRKTRNLPVLLPADILDHLFESSLSCLSWSREYPTCDIRISVRADHCVKCSTFRSFVETGKTCKFAETLDTSLHAILEVGCVCTARFVFVLSVIWAAYGLMLGNTSGRKPAETAEVSFVFHLWCHLVSSIGKVNSTK